MKNKELLSEEILQMKYLFGYKKGMVISEQVTGTPQTFASDSAVKTSDVIKSENQEYKRLIDAEHQKLKATRKQNFKSIVDDKKENIELFIEEVKNFIDDEKADIKTFAKKVLNTGQNIVSAIDDKVQKMKDEFGDSVENIKIKNSYKEAEKLKKEFAEFKVKTEELEMTGRVLTDEEKRQIKKWMIRILFQIISIFGFFSLAPILGKSASMIGNGVKVTRTIGTAM